LRLRSRLFSESLGSIRAERAKHKEIDAGRRAARPGVGSRAGAGAAGIIDGRDPGRYGTALG